MPLRPRDKAPIGRRMLLYPAEALVAAYLVLDDIFTPVFLPVARWLATLRLVLRFEHVLGALPPYGILVVLAIPFFIGDPAKVYGLYLIGTGSFVRGVAVIALAYFVTLVIADRIYAAGKAKLRTIRWFAFVMDWLMELRDRLYLWARSTRIWGHAEAIMQHMRGIVGKVARRTRRMLARLRLRLRRG